MLQTEDRPVEQELIAYCCRCHDLIFIDALVSRKGIVKLFTNHVITQRRHIGVQHRCGGSIRFFHLNSTLSL